MMVRHLTKLGCSACQLSHEVFSMCNVCLVVAFTEVHTKSVWCDGCQQLKSSTMERRLQRRLELKTKIVCSVTIGQLEK